MCKAKPKETAQPTLSSASTCQCQLNVHVCEKHFKRLEHAYFWRMSTEFGKHDLATEIQNSQHAGVAKNLIKGLQIMRKD